MYPSSSMILRISASSEIAVRRDAKVIPWQLYIGVGALRGSTAGYLFFRSANPDYSSLVNISGWQLSIAILFLVCKIIDETRAEVASVRIVECRVLIISLN